MNKSARKLYWLGNIAKTRIIDEILRLHADRDDKIVVFDYGCGDGGDWPAILGDNQRIELIGFEPSEQGYCFASERLRGFNSRILTGDAIDTLALQADFIVSFSVFEHVVDKREYLRHAKRLLARDGTCYLNYDDGHFRNILDLSVRETWMPAIRSRLRTLISPIMASLGQQAKYQRRVAAEVADSLSTEAGFKIVRVDYHNLASLKELAKTIPIAQQEAYARWWLDAELELNEDFRTHSPIVGACDGVNLSRQMASRTVSLRHG